MDHTTSYYPFDTVDNSIYPPISETLYTTSTHNEGYGNCPVMATMNAVPFASPNPLIASNTGPFVTMHISHYLSLMNQIEGRAQSGGPFVEHPREPATSAAEVRIVPAVAAPSREAPEHAQQPASITKAVALPGKHYRRRLKVACYSCNDAHKTCDQGRPCERCMKRGIDASCEYPPTKEGRRVRNRASALVHGEC